MRKSMKNKKEKVPKITEAEYTAYLTSLKRLSEEEEKMINEDMDALSLENSSIKEE